MGFSFHGKKHEADKERHLKRLHKTTPFIESPLVGADANSLVFSQRHEANSVELFFDLFFVANLATFTAYHSITDGDYLLGYIGFFGILWCCWFQITLHDVRFARDSLYERICKTIQFIVFVGLALVGSQFNPTSKNKGDNTNFRIMCYVLVISRGLLTIQYMVVLFYTWKAKYSKLLLPLGLMVGIYAVATAIFAGMTPAFKKGTQGHTRVYLVWYAVMFIEAILIVGISCFWRMLSFKKTHLMERMSLLTIIVIGEGAIGVTKTVGKIMGKHGLDVEGCFLIMCIIVILVLLWALYFDNFPHGHYGTIRQQVWSLLHFPFQLGIVGVVEGSQQLALARYVSKSAQKVTKSLTQYCMKENLDGKKLQEKLELLLAYFELDKKEGTLEYYYIVQESIWNLGNATGICSKATSAGYTSFDTWPEDLMLVDEGLANGLFVGLGMKLPVDKLKKYTPLDIAIRAWKIVYMYYWGSFCTVIVCLIIFLILIRRHKADLFDYTSIIFRSLVLGVGAAMMALLAVPMRLYNAISSPALLPICVILLFLILCVDKMSALWCNWRLKKSGQPYALEFHEEHEHHGGHDEHGDVHDKGGEHHDSTNLEDLSKGARWSQQSAGPLVGHTEYHSPSQHGYVMDPLSPPMISPDPSGPPPHKRAPSGPSGYMPISGGQNYGA
jgi:low temperature requirement protein LtrA